MTTALPDVVTNGGLISFTSCVAVLSLGKQSFFDQFTHAESDEPSQCE
jgi:hypothetical protein